MTVAGTITSAFGINCGTGNRDQPRAARRRLRAGVQVGSVSYLPAGAARDPDLHDRGGEQPKPVCICAGIVLIPE